MCLPNFERFDNISEDKALVGYRSWRLSVKNPANLISEAQDYNWDKVIEGPHEVKDKDSGIYAYNNYNYYDNYNNYNYYYNYNYNNDNYYNYNYNYYNYDNYNYNYDNYKIFGIINQYGKVAIHKIGQRSEYARITKFFTIRELDARGLEKFLIWIKNFNLIIIELAKKYECNTIHYQDFIEGQRQ